MSTLHGAQVKARPATKSQLKAALRKAHEDHGKPEPPPPPSGGGGADATARKSANDAKKSAKDNAAAVATQADLLQAHDERLTAIETHLSAPPDDGLRHPGD